MDLIGLMFGRYFSICAPMPNNEEETVVSCALSWHQNSTVFYKSPLNLRIRKKMCMNAKILCASCSAQRIKKQYWL